MSEKIDIPEKYQEFCREVAKLAVKLGVEKAEVKLRPSYDDEWNGEICAFWDMGHRGNKAHRIYIRSEVLIHTDLNGDPKGFHKGITG